MVKLTGKLQPLTDAQVKASARPVETWEQARQRLQETNWACPPFPMNEYSGADYTLAGWNDECEGLEGRSIEWEPGELGC